MNHLTMEQLLELREPGMEPGLAGAREHLEACDACRAEADRLAQRVARLRALPEPRPARDRFLEVRSRYVAARRTRRLQWGGLGSLAVAAGIALMVMVPRGGVPGADPADTELAQMITRSQQLEDALHAWDPDSRMLDGRTATIAARLEDQLNALDRQIEVLKVLEGRTGQARAEQLRLWRERIGLLDALMDVHVTRASYAGL